MTSSSGPHGPGATREARIQRTRAWLRYAGRDLRHARSLLRGEAEAEPYHVTFWAEQATEKALKGFDYHWTRIVR